MPHSSFLIPHSFNLVLDIGNTRAKSAIFQQNKLVEQAVWAGRTFEVLEKLVAEKRIEKCLISSVAEPNEALFKFLKSKFDVRELDSTTPLPFQNQYATPETLGKDRLAAVAGAQILFPEKNVLVIDFGTCIKYELLTAAGEYLGGNIAPGAEMRLKAMQHFTARLPKPPFFLPENPVGNSTETALQNGGLRGVIFETEGVIRLFKKKYGILQTILTGGDAQFFEPSLRPKKQICVQPDLVLIGLNAILEFGK